MSNSLAGNIRCWRWPHYATNANYSTTSQSVRQSDVVGSDHLCWLTATGRSRQRGVSGLRVLLKRLQSIVIACALTGNTVLNSPLQYTVQWLRVAGWSLSVAFCWPLARVLAKRLELNWFTQMRRRFLSRWQTAIVLQPSSPLLSRDCFQVSLKTHLFSHSFHNDYQHCNVFLQLWLTFSVVDLTKYWRQQRRDLNDEVEA